PGEPFIASVPASPEHASRRSRPRPLLAAAPAPLEPSHPARPRLNPVQRRHADNPPEASGPTQLIARAEPQTSLQQGARAGHRPENGQRGEERPETEAAERGPERARPQDGVQPVELWGGSEREPPGYLGLIDGLEQAVALRSVTDPGPAPR